MVLFSRPMPETVSVPQLTRCNNLKSFNHLGFLQQASFCSTTHRLECLIFLQDPGVFSRPVSVPTHRLQQTSSDHLGFFSGPVSIPQLTDCNKLSLTILVPLSRPVSVSQLADCHNLPCSILISSASQFLFHNSQIQTIFGSFIDHLCCFLR